MQRMHEKPFINLPNGKRISFAYLSRVANDDQPISLEQLLRSHLWSTLDKDEQSRLLDYFIKKEKTKSSERV